VYLVTNNSGGMNLFFNLNLERYTMKDKLLRYLKEAWQIGYYPNLYRAKRDLEVCDDRLIPLFYDALSWAVDREYALVKICENGTEKILVHPSYEPKVTT
jgi:hypothetical protein